MAMAVLLLALSLLFLLVHGKVDIRQSASNKELMSRLPTGSFEIVHPFQIRDKNERIGIDTRNYFLHAAEHFQQVTIVIRSSSWGRLKLVVERNNLLFLNQTLFRRFDSSGEHSLRNRVEGCYYQGALAGDPLSFVAFSSCNGLRGVIAFSNGTTLGLWPLDGGEKGRRHPHVLYRTTWPWEASCGATATAAEQLALALTSGDKELRRERRRDVAGKQTKYMEVALIGDYQFVKNSGDEDAAVAFLLDAVNTADLMLSRDLNIRLSVVYVELWLDAQRIDLHEDSERTLAGLVDYSAGHMYHLNKDMSLLFTAGSFANSEMVTATPSSICSARAAGIVKAGESWTSHLAGQLLAHAVGHSLGLDHDSESCQCDLGRRCVMNPQLGSEGVAFSWQFSKCSVARMLSVWQSGHVLCLLNRPFQESALRECGNRVVDGSEECDCGSREECDDDCCDPLTCTLRPHAQCASHQPCCQRCELRRAGEVCRGAKSLCDVAETCDGLSGECPSDGHLVDGTSCGQRGQCWMGNCSDPHVQCATLWGEGASLADAACFEQNTKGLEYANCGVTSSGEPRPCQSGDVRCGSLHCEGGRAEPLSAARAFTLQFLHHNKSVQCRAIAAHPRSLVEDGALCGSGRVCVQGSCVEMATVSRAVVCPSNNHALQCSGHGDCTTSERCLCFDGWSGSACDTRDNSSRRATPPPTNPPLRIPSFASGRSLDTTTLLGILLLVGVALLLLLVCLLFCYSGVEIPTSCDEKAEESFVDETQRAIKFGNMPSYREEKRKRKSNKRVYGALNRITEADERDSASLRSRDSNSIANGFDLRHVGSALVHSSRPDLVEEGVDDDPRIYESTVCAVYGEEPDVFVVRQRRSEVDWRGAASPPSPAHSSSSSQRLAQTPLKLNNIGLLLRQLQCPEEGASEAELSAVEADHELGSNTESMRGFDEAREPPCDPVSAVRDSPLPEPPDSFDYGESPSLFQDSYRLQLSTSSHSGVLS